MILRHAAMLGLLSVGCATSSASNYSIEYRTSGAANETGDANKAAAKAFEAEATDPALKQAISRVKVFTDSVPPELTLKDNVVALAEGVSAKLIGSVEVSAVLKAPDDEQVLPALQKAAQAVGADIAFCPPNEKPAGHIWRCYLVRASGAADVVKGTVLDL
jgi:hypothetical protein